MRARAGWLLIGAMAVAACGGDTDAAARGAPDTLPLAESLVTDPTEHTGLSADLAPSQLTDDTVAAPDTPGPCDVGDLEFWTAQVAIGESTTDAVIRVRNAGDEWCEPDISGSPFIDPDIEPDVWLDPGGWADLVAVGRPGCEDSAAVHRLPVDVNGSPIEVLTAMIVSCGWDLTAFFPNEVAVEACDPATLDAVVVEGFVLVRNPVFVPCLLGDLVAIEGVVAAAEPSASEVLPALRELAGGDVVGFRYSTSSGGSCDSGVTSGVLVFDVAGDAEVAGLPCAADYELGPGRPWFGDSGGPLAPFTGRPVDVDAARAALDPFVASSP